MSDAREDRTRAPALFIGHGAPTVAMREDEFTRALAAYGRQLPTLRAIVVISAHWQVPVPIRATASARPRLIYDFYDFPREMYTLTYPCPGAPEVAAEAIALLSESGVVAVRDDGRGLDHGVWIPLRIAHPGAETPVVQVSLPKHASPRDLLRMGRALAPLRERGVLLVGSGNVVHNLGALHFDDVGAPVDAWAAEFDAWV